MGHRSIFVGALAVGGALALSVGCGSDDESGGSEPMARVAACVPGDAQACTGPGGCDGVETCLADASGFGACSCGSGGGADAGPDGRPTLPEAGLPRECAAAEVPARPSVGGVGGRGDFFVAMSTISYLDDTAFVGFNLTTAQDTAECTKPQSVTGGATDPDCEITNAVGDLFADNPSVDVDGLNTLITDGSASLLIRVQDFAEAADDDQVTVDLFSTASYDAFGLGDSPSLDGTDVWPIASTTLEDGAGSPFDRPKIRDAEAYVSGGQLVASFDFATLRLPFDFQGIMARPFELDLSDVLLVCDIGEVAAQWELSGCFLAARWRVQSILEGFASPPAPEPSLCTDSPDYLPVKQYICGFADVLYAGSTSPDCDALSVGIRFDTVGALPGNVFQVEPPVAACTAATDPSDDLCDLAPDAP